MLYGKKIWGPTMKQATDVKRLGEEQRPACLGIEGAMRTAVLETLLNRNLVFHMG